MYVKPHVCCDYPTMNNDSYYPVSISGDQPILKALYLHLREEKKTSKLPKH